MTDYRSLSADELWTALGQSYRTPDLDLISACLEQREELTPALLKALEDGPDLDWEHDDPRWFLEIHAGLLLCAYREPAALVVFAQVFRDPDRDNLVEWFTYDLPTAYGLAALPMLLELMNDDDAYPYARSATMAMLVVIAQNHPDEHDRIVASLQSLLPILTENGELPPDTRDSELWTWIALSLADLKDETSLPQIMALYQGGMIDEWAIGNQERLFGIWRGRATYSMLQLGEEAIALKVEIKTLEKRCDLENAIATPFDRFDLIIQAFHEATVETVHEIGNDFIQPVVKCGQERIETGQYTAANLMCPLDQAYPCVVLGQR